jgi:hypothetical protein
MVKKCKFFRIVHIEMAVDRSEKETPATLFICSLFYDAFSTNKTIAANDRVISERQIGKDLRRYPGISVEGLGKTTKTSVRIVGISVEI